VTVRQDDGAARGAKAGARRAATLAERVDDAFRAFVGDPRFPCLAAKGTMRRRGYRLGVYGAFGSADAAVALARDLTAFVRAPAAEGAPLTAFVAVFPGRAPTSERAFERRLWAQIQRLHECDDPAVGWDPRVSADPDDPSFAFSFAGRAFYVVGLHPRSSRLARRFRWCALVFNPHAQFARLRAEGRFARLRALIRARDVVLQGSFNPSLADFGERSEARQYSGRATEAEWRCPFHPRIP
jgi:uncharacterized protein